MFILNLGQVFGAVLKDCLPSDFPRHGASEVVSYVQVEVVLGHGAVVLFDLRVNVESPHGFVTRLHEVLQVVTQGRQRSHTQY